MKSIVPTEMDIQTQCSLEVVACSSRKLRRDCIPLVSLSSGAFSLNYVFPFQLNKPQQKAFHCVLRYSQVLLFPRVTLLGAAMQSQNRALTRPSYRITSCAADSLICERKKNSKTKLNPQSVQERKTQTCCALERVSNTNISKEESFQSSCT